MMHLAKVEHVQYNMKALIIFTIYSQKPIGWWSYRRPPANSYATILVKKVFDFEKHKDDVILYVNSLTGKVGVGEIKNIPDRILTSDRESSLKKYHWQIEII